MTTAIRADVGVTRGSAVISRRGGPLRYRREGIIWTAAAPVVAVALLLTLSACGQKRVVAAPPLPAPVNVPPPPAMPTEPVSEPQTAAQLPEPQPIPPDALPRAAGPLADIDEPSDPPANPQPEPAPVVRADESIERPPRPESAAPTPVPTLGQILSQEDRQAYNEMIDRSIDGAQKNLATVLGRPLRPEQSAAVRRIRAFIQQAGAARERDLALAKNLADRALLLAQDLARSVQ